MIKLICQKASGEKIDITGMVVTATYNDGSTKEVTNYTITDGNNLTAGKTSVTISYTENGVTKETTQGITVVEKVVTGIAVTKAPFTSTVPQSKLEEVAVTV